MLKDFIDMINQADMLNGCTTKDDKIVFDGEEVDVTIVSIQTSESGDCVEAIFHKGTDSLIDMNVKHVCTCGHCKH